MAVCDQHPLVQRFLLLQAEGLLIIQPRVTQSVTLGIETEKDRTPKEFKQRAN